MTVLGEAFIEVKGDLRPFIRDLDKELKAVTEAFEKRLGKSLQAGLKDVDKIGEDTGDKLGDGVGRRIKRRMGDKKQPLWLSITSAFASALDDGISALPMEVKAAIVFGIAAALPLISGALAGAVAAAVGAGVAGIGVAFAFQYDEIRQRGATLVNDLRLMFIDFASPFVPAMFTAMDTIENRFESWTPLLARIFSKGANFLEPLVQGGLDLLGEIFEGIDSSLDDTSGFVLELSRGLKVLGHAIGRTIEILASTGESGREAFRDFLFLVANLLVSLANLLKILTEIYHLMRVPFFGAFAKAADEFSGAGLIMVQRNHQIAESTNGVIRLTDEETKRLKELEKSLKDASDATYEIVQSQVDFQRALDHIDESLDENGKTLDINKEKGRQNVESFINALRSAQKETAAQVAMGKLSAQQAADYYNQQIEAVRKLAFQAGITGAQFDSLFGDIIAVAQLKLDAAAMGLTNTTDELAQGVTEAAKLYDQLKRIRDFRLPAKGTRPFSEYAEGGIVTQPTQALIGEAGPEVVIPLTRPSRAAALMEKSGLAGMLSAAATLVQVFIGNEQLEGRMVQVVEKNNAALGNSLAFGARGL